MAQGGGAKQVEIGTKRANLGIRSGQRRASQASAAQCCTAEIFGTELPLKSGSPSHPRLRFAVFTWYGATIEMDGSTETDYTADEETPNISYVKCACHYWKNGRNRAKASPPDDSNSSQPQGLHGPRVIVVGPADSGKNALVQNAS
ncbi:hypothetical protein GBA52_025476 [Prunus armeniaca]|nr:hypothetical protein GBA52_025476 [Prunus armeniaca]